MFCDIDEKFVIKKKIKKGGVIIFNKKCLVRFVVFF